MSAGLSRRSAGRYTGHAGPAAGVDPDPAAVQGHGSPTPPDTSPTRELPVTREHKRICIIYTHTTTSGRLTPCHNSGRIYQQCFCGSVHIVRYSPFFVSSTFTQRCQLCSARAKLIAFIKMKRIFDEHQPCQPCPLVTVEIKVSIAIFPLTLKIIFLINIAYKSI